MTANVNKKKILIVDDEERNLKLLKIFCDKLGYESMEAKNGKEAIDKVVKYTPDLIIMDIMMPEMDGLTATEILKKHEKASFIPIIILTALSSKEDMIMGISRGADDFLTKPLDLQEFSLRAKNHLKIKEYHDILKNNNTYLDEQVKNRTIELRDTFKRLDRAYTEIKLGYIETIQRLSLAAEYKDEETGMHIKRVNLYMNIIAEEINMNDEFTNTIYHASPMHDLGKVGIPDKVLLKNGSLTVDEWSIMTNHTLIGKQILSGSESPFLRMAAEIALTHHEKWDGSGYPKGLKGEEIPISGRIMSIADQYDALRNKRPYKPELNHDRVFEIITKGDGRTHPGHFDPLVLDAFKRTHKKFEEAGNSYKKKRFF